MKPEIFVKSFLPDALKVQKKTGISALAILAQAVLESAWGEIAPGNMFFGVKDYDGINGNEQLITTTEYTRSSKNPMHIAISSTPYINKQGVKMFKHKGKDYFRKFDTPADCFEHHAQLFLHDKKYAAAVKVGADYEKFFFEIKKAGYATDPDYVQKLTSIAKSLEKRM